MTPLLPHTHPLRATEQFSAAAIATLRKRAVFEAGKWDPQVHDGPSLAPFALRISDRDWSALRSAAESLWCDMTAIERAVRQRPRILNRLGIPRRTRAAINAVPPDGPAVRFARFDFHPTTQGWRVSEVNADVPGGFLESGPIARMVAEHAGGSPPPDTAALIADELASRLPGGAAVALVHATAYTDDLQVMDHFRRLLEPRGLTGVPCSPGHLRWESDGRCTITLSNSTAAAIVRFFPAEWLANMPRSTPITPFFSSLPNGPILANPAAALAIQSKRVGLFLDALGVEAPAWREFFPAVRPAFPLVYTRRTIPDKWVLKPAMGRVGEGVVIPGATRPQDTRRALLSARIDPRHWLLQERFTSLPVDAAGTPYHACIGVYVVNGRAAGAYARVSPRPLIDAHAQDAALLIDAPTTADSHAEPDPVTERSTARATAGVL